MDGGSCNGAGHICSNGNCVACGAVGQICCPGNGCGANACVAGKCAVPCSAGGACTGNPNPCRKGQVTCNNGTQGCGDGAAIDGGACNGAGHICSNGACVACGGIGQVCCPGNGCGGNVCQAGKCVASCTVTGCCADKDCGFCMKCQNGRCTNQARGENLKNECNGGTCKSASCNGAGACDVVADGKQGPGCQGACQSCQRGACATTGLTTCYPDLDGDGYPDMKRPEQSCSSTCLPGSIRARSDGKSDCYDKNGSAHPGLAASEHFTDDRGDGSFDWDCDGKETKLVRRCDGCKMLAGGQCDPDPNDFCIDQDGPCGSIVPSHSCFRDCSISSGLTAFVICR
jgi:hypothetical protein